MSEDTPTMAELAGDTDAMLEEFMQHDDHHNDHDRHDRDDAVKDSDDIEPEEGMHIKLCPITSYNVI